MTRHKLATSARVASGILSFALVTGCGGGSGYSSNNQASSNQTSNNQTNNNQSSTTGATLEITAVGPDCAPPFVGQLTVAGQGFVSNSVVRWNGSDRPTTFQSATELSVQVAATDISAAKMALVSVYNPAAGGSSSDSYAFTITPSGVSPTFVAVDPSGTFVYVANQGCGISPLGYISSIGYISTYTSDASTGLLTPSGSSATSYDEGARFIAASPAGHFLYLANDGGGDTAGSVSAYTVDPTTGGLTFVANMPAPCKAPPSPGSCSPWSVSIDPSGRFLYVANEGGFQPTSISAYSIDPTTGILTSIETIEAVDRANEVTLDPSGKYAYAVTCNEPGTAPGAVTTYSLDVASGSMTYVGTIPAGVNPTSISVDRAGRFAYVVNTGSNTISAYTISAGNLTSAGTISAGMNPVSMSVDPTTKFAYVANAVSNDIYMYKIDATTGALTSIGTIAAGTSPASIAIDPTGTFAYVVNSSSDDVWIYRIDAATGALALVGTIGT